MKNKKNVFTPSVKNILKTTIIAPAISISAFTCLYLLWWISSKLFYFLHDWMAGSVWPWFKSAWGFVIGVWIFIIITSIIYTILTEKNKLKKQTQTEEEKKKFEISNQIKGNLHEMVINWEEYFSDKDNNEQNEQTEQKN